MDDIATSLLLAIDIALTASAQLSENEVSLESVVEKQDKALEILERNITIDKNENDRIQKTIEATANRMKAGRSKPQNKLAKLYNKSQKIRVYLSYYVNKLGGGDTDSLSVGSTTYFKEKPEEALKDLLERNAEDLKILERAIPILHLARVKTGGKRKKTRRNRRKNKRKNKTKNKRKAKRKTKNKRKRKHRKTKKQKNDKR